MWPFCATIAPQWFALLCVRQPLRCCKFWRIRTPDSVDRPPCSQWCSRSVICLGSFLHGESWLAGYYPTSPTSLRRDRTRVERDPLALLPVARSPSRLQRCNRWWALTPPFHPLPAMAGGNTLCCGCSQPPVTGRLPPLAVSWGNLVTPKGATGSREVPLRVYARSDRFLPPDLLLLSYRAL